MKDKDNFCKLKKRNQNIHTVFQAAAITTKTAKKKAGLADNKSLFPQYSMTGAWSVYSLPTSTYIIISHPKVKMSLTNIAF